MEAIPKLIETLGKEVRPFVFSIATIAFVALWVPNRVWQNLGSDGLPLPRFLFVGIAFFGFLYLLFEPLTNQIKSWWGTFRLEGAKAKKHNQILGLSERSRALLFLLLKGNMCEFPWDMGDPMIEELEKAGIIVPDASNGFGMDYELSDWYRYLTISDRQWLLSNLRSESRHLEELASILGSGKFSGRI